MCLSQLPVIHWFIANSGFRRTKAAVAKCGNSTGPLTYSKEAELGPAFGMDILLRVDPQVVRVLEAVII